MIFSPSNIALSKRFSWCEVNRPFQGPVCVTARIPDGSEPKEFPWTSLFSAESKIMEHANRLKVIAFIPSTPFVCDSILLLQFDCVIRKAFLDMLSGSTEFYLRERVVFLYQIFTPRGEVKVWNFLFGSVIFLLCFDCFWFHSFWLKLKVEIVYYCLGLAGSFVVGESNNFEMFLIWSWLGNLFGNKMRAQYY